MDGIQSSAFMPRRVCGLPVASGECRYSTIRATSRPGVALKWNWPISSSVPPRSTTACAFCPAPAPRTGNGAKRLNPGTETIRAKDVVSARSMRAKRHPIQKIIRDSAVFAGKHISDLYPELCALVAATESPNFCPATTAAAFPRPAWLSSSAISLSRLPRMNHANECLRTVA